MSNVKEISKQSDDEIVAALKSVETEKLDGGHSLARHGTQVTDAELETRLKTGVAPDGAFSPAPASTKFNSYENWLKTREIAWKKIEQLKGVDLSKPPTSNMDDNYVVRINYGKPIDDGYVPDRATRNRISVQDPATGRTRRGNVYSTVDPVDSVTGVFTKVIWDSDKNKWGVVQHYPLTQGWNNVSKTYSGGARIDASVNLP